MSKKQKESVTVAFRLTVEEHRMLVAEAESRRQTPGTYARQVVLDAVQDRRNESLTEEFRRSFNAMQQKLGVFATVLLSNRLPLPSEVVKDWVRATWFENRITDPSERSGSNGHSNDDDATSEATS